MKSDLRFMVDYLLGGLKKKVAEKKLEALEEWQERFMYCVDHMDADEYGRDFVNNITVFAGLSSGKLVEIKDRVVNNTLVQLCRELADILGIKRHPLLKLIVENQLDTVLQNGKWIYRAHRQYLCQNTHSGTVQAVFEKGTSVDEFLECCEMFADLLKERGILV